jgi:hypothetical protein
VTCLAAILPIIAAAAGASVRSSLSLALSVSQDRAITDSGASFTYKGGLSPLDDEQPGVGWVSVANGHQEPIAGVGRYGPISGARRVAGFPRTLVSVSDLIEQFGSVVFDTKGVHVVSSVPDQAPVATTIGCRTPSRLFSFDSPSLTRHVSELESLGVSGPINPDMARLHLGAMGVRWSTVAA